MTTTRFSRSTGSLISPASDENALSALTGPDAAQATAATAEVQAVVTPTITIDPIAGDNILTPYEGGFVQTRILSGTTTGVEAGRTVNIRLSNFVDMVSATVEADGSWRTELTFSEMDTLLRQGVGPAEISTETAAGQSVSISVPLHMDPDWPSLIINAFSGDNIISGPEGQAIQILSGSTHHVEAGQTVTLTLNGHTYTATVGEDGYWQTTVPAAEVAALPDGAKIIATVSNLAGQEAGYTSKLTVDSSLPSLTINPFAADHVLSDAEALRPQTLSGTTSGIEAGQTVTLTLNYKTYSATVAADGSFTTTVPAADLLKLYNGQTEITASATNLAGQTTHGSDILTVAYTSNRLTVNPIAGDNYVNVSEAGSLVISGTAPSLPVGSIIRVEFADKTFSDVVTANGKWSIDVDYYKIFLLPDGQYNFTITAPGSAPVTREVGLYLNRENYWVKMDTPFGDGVLTPAEAAQGQVLTGTASKGMLRVEVSVGNGTYQGNVDAEGHWRVTLPPDGLQELAFWGTLASVTVYAFDVAENRTTTSHDIEIIPGEINLTLDPVTGDNIITAAEAAAGITLSGSADPAAAWLTVTVMLNGVAHTTTINEDGSWSVPIPTVELINLPDGTVTATASVPGTTPATLDVNVAIQASPTPAFDLPFGDGVLTAEEAATDQLITGTTGVSGSGQTVTLTLNGKTYAAAVDNDGHWQATLPAVDLQALPEGAAALSVIAADAAGNSGSAATTAQVDLAFAPITINTVAGDNLINYAEGEAGITLSGMTDGLPAGTELTLTILQSPGNGSRYYTTTTRADGSWSYEVSSDELYLYWKQVNQQTLTVKAPDGQSASVEIGMHYDLGTAHLDPPFGGEALTLEKAAVDQLLTGTTGLYGPGQTATVTMEGITYNGSVDEEGNWQVILPSSALQALAGKDATTLIVTVSDIAGNTVTDDRNFVTVDLVAPTLTLEPVATDNVITFAEAEKDITISGTSSEADVTVTVTLGGLTLTTEAGWERNWQVTIPAHTLSGRDGSFPDGDYQLVITARDPYGNTSTTTQDLRLEVESTVRPVLRIHNISGDNLINGAELQSDQVITGSSENVEGGQTLSLKIGSVTYTTQIQPGGGWSLSVPAEDLAALGDGGLTLRASVTDAAGHRATASRNLNIQSERDGLSIDPVTGDNLINGAEAGGAITLTGHTDGVQHGATVQLTLNNKHYTATVGEDGNWSATLPAADVAALEEGSATLTACVKSACGQMLYAKTVLTVDTTAPELAFNPVTGDNLISVQEAQAGFALTGSAGIAAAGLLVLVVLNGVDYHATVQADGDWSVAIPSEALAEQPAGDYPLTVSLTDVAGNLTSITSAITLDAAPDTDTAESVSALTVTSQATTAGSADSTLTAALVTPEAAATDTSAGHGTYTIGGQTLNLTEHGGEAIGGSGNDTIVLHTLDFLHIDGGSGTDTLLLAGSDQHLNLTALGLKIENIDIFDLGQSGSNSLTLGLHEAEAVRDTPEESLVIRGADGSQLTLAGDGSAWETHGQREVGGLTFDVYHATGLENADALGDLLVQHGIQVQQV
ncbi:hypothetical protein CYR55_06070 [Chimaeribacter californicus]|uniref:Bacterial Ig-like domain-containing protein n=1 Tax=Chimaeribacter californicus TaxID=2060067 RepID=A0A2N5EE89_9GAMM|nr:Ig-like domain-containing protein [Chimaeribacter californicus]PLR40841.1 hypothetical protein CYR55_06070 [Chimaeribacter californicus]